MPKRDSQSSSTATHASASSHRSKRRSPTQRQGVGNTSTGSSSRAGASSSHAATTPPAQPNFDSADPYTILGVPVNATFQQIKLSYRKLALKHHPDRQSTEVDKKAAHQNFAAIGNAYEILGDESRRREHDDGILQQQQQQQQQQQRGQQQQRQQGSSSGSRQSRSTQDPFSMFNDPFFSSSFGAGMSRGGHSGRPSRSDFHFTDPFELFEQVFAEEMRHHNRHHNNPRSSSRNNDPFASDPFFSSGNSFSDPFFSSGGSMFGGGGLSQMMSGHFDRMNSMMSQTQMHGQSMFDNDRHQQQFMRRGGNVNGGSSYNFASSSSSSFNRGGQQSVSTSTRTTIVNGVRKTIREHTVVHPDGRVDRNVETLDGGDNNANRISSADHSALGYDGGRRRGHR